MCVFVCMCNQQLSEEWGRNAESVSLQCFSGMISQQLPFVKASAGRGEPEKIRLCLFSLRASNRIPVSRLLYCPFWSPSIFLCKAVSFSVIESILRLIVSVSMLTALPTASIMTGSLVRL